MTADLLGAVRALGPLIRELAAGAELERRLPAQVAEAFGAAGLWRAAVPRSVGGLELPLAEQLGVIEEVAIADGAAGWCAMIGMTSGVVSAYLDPSVARALFDDSAAAIGGVFAPMGRATEVEGGVRVSGRWPFASGIEHCTWGTFGVVMAGDGPPDLRAVVVAVSDLEILDTWAVSGLRGTGSHDVTLDDVYVPSERLYRLIGGTPLHSGPLYTFPVFGSLALGVCAVALGLARSAIDELVELAGGKTPSGSRRRLADRAHVQMEVAQAEASLRAARSFVFGAVDEAWGRAEAGDEATLEDRAVLRLAATHATRTAADVVDRMYDAGGGTSIYATSRLQRDFRDVHAATQHTVIAPATYELAGRVLLGVETDVSQL